MDTLDDNSTWTLVKLPIRKKTIGCKWIFTTKVNPVESIAQLKTHLIANGFAQTYKVNYIGAIDRWSRLIELKLSFDI